jgi:hypothetical protein
MPNPLLDGARLKVVRAQEHLQAFNAVGWEYIKTDPYEIRFVKEGDFIGMDCVITTEPPPTLACIIGDFVTNLRAALDYIAWEMAIKANPALSDREQGLIFFPLILPPKTKADFAGNQRVAHLRDVCRVPATAIDEIERVQPYQTGHESLAALDSLVRVDKHRTLLLCASVIQESGVVRIYHGDKLAATCWGVSTRMRQNVAAMGDMPRRADEFHVEVEGKPTILVALKDVPAPMTYVGILQNILERVANIVERFDPIV